MTLSSTMSLFGLRLLSTSPGRPSPGPRIGFSPGLWFQPVKRSCVKLTNDVRVVSKWGYKGVKGPKESLCGHARDFCLCLSTTSNENGKCAGQQQNKQVEG